MASKPPPIDDGYKRKYSDLIRRHRIFSRILQSTSADHLPITSVSAAANICLKSPKTVVGSPTPTPYRQCLENDRPQITTNTTTAAGIHPQITGVMRTSTAAAADTVQHQLPAEVAHRINWKQTSKERSRSRRRFTSDDEVSTIGLRELSTAWVSAGLTGILNSVYSKIIIIA